MSKAPRPATWKTRSRTWAGQNWWLGQRRSLSPSFCCASVVPQAGHSVGMTHSARPVGAQRQHRADDLGDHVTRLAQDHGVAGADVLALDLVGVVEGGVLDRRAGHAGRLHDAVRRDPAGAADVDPDLEELGVDLLGRVLERDRPPGCPAGGAEPALEADVVDLDHDAVDLVGTIVCRCSPALVMYFSTAFRVGSTSTLLRGRQPPRLQCGVGRGLRGRLEPLAGADAVAHHAQRAGRGHLRVLLPQRARCRVARVGEDRLAGVGHGLVEPLERFAGEEHLAAHLEHRRHREVIGRREPVRDRVDGLHVGRDVLAGAAVAAGQGPHEATLLVEQVDGQPVDLELAEQGRVGDAVSRQAGMPGRPARRRRRRCPGSPSAGCGRWR